MNINIPKKAAELILLAQNNLAKHLADGASSVLDHLDMTGMSAIVIIADAKHSLFLQKSRDSEKATENRDIALGTERGQRLTPGTVRFYATSIRDLLLGIYKGNERTLGDWSFEVNIDSSVVIPRNASELIALAKGILAKHTADGAGSPLGSLNMADMQAKTNTADSQHALSKTWEQTAEEASQDRDLALGHGTNQNSYTPGTVLFFVCSIRDVLLGTFRGRERALGDWGFGVNASAEVPAPPAPASISVTTDQNLPSMLNVNVTGNSFSTGAELIITWLMGIFNSSIPVNGMLINFQYLYTSGIYTFNITGLLSAIGTLQIAGANLTSILIPAGLHIANLDLSNNKLDLDRVNGVIIALDANGILGGTLNLSGGTNAAPTGAGLTAKNNLIAKGWTVTTN